MKKHLFLSFSMLVLASALMLNVFKPSNNNPIPAPKSQVERLNEYMILAVLYHQTAAEVRGLQYQAFNMSKTVLNEKLKSYKGKKKPAVVVDIDETVLDNCQFQAQCILGNFQYPVKWDEWCLLGQAPAIPGAVDFLNYANSKGVAVFYVSNRKAHLKDATVKNLINEGFPNVKDPFLMLRTAESSKDKRREIIEKDYEILMLFGDNMGDFTSEWSNKSIEERFKATDKNKEFFGSKYIVFPNSTYGDWEAAIYNHDFSLESAIKYRMRKEALKGF
jgi:5'-nucleotidase (lipoprotein e(P4) family)